MILPVCNNFVIFISNSGFTVQLRHKNQFSSISKFLQKADTRNLYEITPSVFFHLELSLACTRSTIACTASAFVSPIVWNFQSILCVFLPNYHPSRPHGLPLCPRDPPADILSNQNYRSLVTLTVFTPPAAC